MCGSTGPSRRCRVEGVEMDCCARCASMGVKVESPRRVKRPRPKHKVEEPEDVEMIREDFAEVLRAERQKRGLTQSQFSDLLGEKESVLAHYEQRKGTPNIRRARHYERVLGIPLVETVSTASPFEIKKIGGGGMTIGDLIKVKK